MGAILNMLTSTMTFVWLVGLLVVFFSAVPKKVAQYKEDKVMYIFGLIVGVILSALWPAFALAYFLKKQ